MKLKFSKMHSLGNDFVIMSNLDNKIILTSQQIKALSDRHRGVGFDQLLLVEKAANETMDFFYRIFNADGGQVAQCGNGARCFAYYVYQRGLIAKKYFSLGTLAGNLAVTIHSDGQVSASLGVPTFEPEKIPYAATSRQACYDLAIANGKVNMFTLAIGNPHCVMQVPDVTTAAVAKLGAQIAKHPDFSQGVNVGFMEVVDRHSIELRVFERGCGETLACGSGACAAVVAGIMQGWLGSTVQVTLPGGQVTVKWSGEGQAVELIGPVSQVFEGVIDIAA